MTGRVVRFAVLTSAQGRAVRAHVYRPDASSANVQQLAATYQRWRAQAAQFERSMPSVAFHANFAAEVAWLAATSLPEWSARPRDFVLVVTVDDAGEVLGINTAYWVPEESGWYFAVGTTRPADQPGYPNPDQVRGVGMLTLGGLLDEVNAIVCARITLEPLDDDARRFWLRRGFTPTDGEMELGCADSKLLRGSLPGYEPDYPDRGDCVGVTCGDIRSEAAGRRRRGRRR